MNKLLVIKALIDKCKRYERALYFLNMKVFYAKSDEKESISIKELEEVLNMAGIDKERLIVFYDNCNEIAYEVKK